MAWPVNLATFRSIQMDRSAGAALEAAGKSTPQIGRRCVITRNPAGPIARRSRDCSPWPRAATRLRGTVALVLQKHFGPTVETQEAEGILHAKTNRQGLARSAR